MDTTAEKPRLPKVVRSAAMAKIWKVAGRIAPTLSTVLLSGETGVGKELVAQFIHEKSPRANHPFVKFNCATVPKDLLDGELFGHRKGAFTGAMNEREGLFFAAHQGTIFLDELHEMPLECQAKLLRVLEDGEVRKLGGVEVRTVDVRVVAAIAEDPDAAIKAGKLHRGVYHRISSIEIKIPPLRARGEEIIPIAEAYLDYFCELHGRPKLKLSDDIKMLLVRQNWPGNIRQLKNEMQSAALISDGPVVTEEDLSFRSLKVETGNTPAFKGELERVEYQAILKSLMMYEGNILSTAEFLGIGRQTLYNKIEYYHLTVTRDQAREGV